MEKDPLLCNRIKLESAKPISAQQVLNESSYTDTLQSICLKNTIACVGGRR